MQPQRVRIKPSRRCAERLCDGAGYRSVECVGCVDCLKCMRHMGQSLRGDNLEWFYGDIGACPLRTYIWHNRSTPLRGSAYNSLYSSPCAEMVLCFEKRQSYSLKCSPSVTVATGTISCRHRVHGTPKTYLYPSQRLVPAQTVSQMNRLSPTYERHSMLCMLLVRTAIRLVEGMALRHYCCGDHVHIPAECSQS